MDEELDDDEPLAPATEQGRRFEILLADMGEQLDLRRGFGLDSIPSSLRSGETGKAMLQLGAVPAGAAPYLRHPLQCMGMASGPAPVRSKADPTLSTEPCYLKNFVPTGPRAGNRNTSPIGGQQGILSRLSTALDKKNDEEVAPYLPGQSVRHIFFLVELRRRWQMNILDHEHPAFLDVTLFDAAWQYSIYLGWLEMFHDAVQVENLDNGLMYDRAYGLWEYGDDIPNAHLARLTMRRPPASQHCIICSVAGHCCETCPKVTGIALPKKVGNVDRPEQKRGQQLTCNDWNRKKGGCKRPNCKFAHACDDCGSERHHTNSTDCTARSL